MSVEQIAVQSTHIESIFVLDDNNNPVTGLVAANFNISISLNGEASALTVTIAEVNPTTNPGEYSVTFTPNATGRWVVYVGRPGTGSGADEEVWTGEYDAIYGDDNSILGQALLAPNITAVVANGDEVEVMYYGADTQTYRIEIRSTTGTVEAYTTNEGNGPVTLTPVNTGSKVIAVFGVNSGSATPTTRTRTMLVTIAG